MRKIIIASFILFSFLGCEAVTEPEQNFEVFAINNRDYFPYVNMRIENATSSIYIIMCYMLYDEENPNYAVNLLLDKLVEAHQEKGVEIKVLLDDEDANVDAKNYLQNRGIEVRFDSDDVRTHSKLLIIDGRSLIIGSTNWTESALNKNNETSVEIMDENIANTYLTYFNEL